MKTAQFIFLVLIAGAVISGCAYGHYLGLHGPSIRNHPEIHAGFTKDADCLACHGPGADGEAPPTSHPNFTGCLKCHNG